MSKKDYQAIARAIHEIAPNFDEDRNVRGALLWGGGGEYAGARTQQGRLVGALVVVLAADNPRFDRERFIEACETGRCKGMSKPDGIPGSETQLPVPARLRRAAQDPS